MAGLLLDRRAALARCLCAFFAVAFWSVAAPSAAQDPRGNEAQNVAREWLVLTDSGEAEASWNAAGPTFRNAISIERWAAALGKVRFPLGALEQRALYSTQFVNEIPGLPQGDYALLKFRTVFAAKTNAEESVTLDRGSDGKWQVVGYVIH
jgi:Protein of unknown function (DUF4019)